MPLSFKDIVLDENKNIYSQIVKHIKMQILTGKLDNGESLPSRRALGVMLNVNPNTIQKAYKELEEEGIIETPSNSNSIIRVNEQITKKLNNELIKNEAREFISFLKEYNLSYKEVLDLISSIWEEV